MSEALKPLPWQEKLWLEITALALQGRLSHALLLGGAAGIGKRHFARALAAFLLCESRSGYACGHCRSCQQFAAGTHPNFLWLRPLTDEKTGKEKRDISVEQIRDFSEKLQLTGHYAQAKIGLIEPADALNLNGVNALLKTIEEPPRNTYMLLVSERPMGLLPTLRSRCQKLRFTPPETAVALQWLRETHGIGDAPSLAAANGAPLQLVALKESGLLERHREWAQALQDLALQKRDPLATAALVDKDQAAAFLAWLQKWLSELLRRKLQRVDAFAMAIPTAALEQLRREAVEGQRRLVGNANAQLLVESLLVLWWHAARAARAA